MIASEIVGDFLLPSVIRSIGVQSIETGLNSRNQYSGSTFSRNNTVSLNPSGTTNSTRNITQEQRMAEINERRVARGEYPIDHLGNRLNPVQIAPPLQPLPPITYTPSFGNNASNTFVPVVLPLDTLPVTQPIINNPAPYVDNGRSVFDEDNEDDLHQQLIDNVMNGIHNDGQNDDSLPLESDNLNDSVEEQKAMNDQRPVRQQYPGGGNGAPSVGDIIKKGDEIVKIISTAIPKRKQEEEEQKKVETKTETPQQKETEKQEKRSKMTGAKVDIHDIFAKTIVNKPSINTKRLL